MVQFCQASKLDPATTEVKRMLASLHARLRADR